jgi:CHAD domain-containing protein
MLEREVKLSVTPSFRFPDLTDLAAAVRTSPVEEQRYETTYFDTADLSLARWDCSLRLRQGEGWTLKLPTTTEGVGLTRRELEFPGSDSRPPDAAVALVRVYVRRSTLVPVVSLSTLRRRTRLTAADGALLAEVVDDDVSVIQGLRVQNRFREVEVELRDPAAEPLLQPILARLHRAGAEQEGKTSKLIRALGARATAAAEVEPLPLREGATLAEVVTHLLATSIASLMRHDPGVRLGDEVEDVHRARVATRRLRSQLRSFRMMLDPAWADRLREDLGWLAGGLGAVRDKQVMSERLRSRATALAPEDAPVVNQLAGELLAESEEARANVVLDMRSDRYIDLIDRLVEASRAPALTGEAQRPAEPQLPGLVRREWKRLEKSVGSLAGVPSDAELHHVRILAKRLRYAAEGAAPVVGKPAQRQAEVVKALQDVLGDHQDSITTQKWLRAAGHGEKAFVAGELTTLERDAARRDRDIFPLVWKKVSRKPLRRWMI